MANIEVLRFLNDALVRKVAEDFSTPTYVYDEATLRQNARDALSFPNAYGLTARYAMKANSNANILRILDKEGMHIDASSGYEVERAFAAGISPEKILLTAQELPHNLDLIMEKEVDVNATSLAQLENIGQRYPGSKIGLRINPGLGSGGSNRTNTGGPGSSFGIWHEDIPEVLALVAKSELSIIRIHTHIGSGSDPEVWQRVSGMSVELLRHFPSVTSLNLGGGYKVGRMASEKSTDLSEIGKPVVETFQRFAEETGRKIRLEIEPGTFMVANAGCLVTRIQSVKKTGSEGYRFYIIDGGMTEILRPSIYGAQHPIVVVPKDASTGEETIAAIVAGHCCESGDIFTPAQGDPEGLLPRLLRKAEAGDFLVVEGAGAYCAAMSTKNYNSFPEAPEVLHRENGELKLIRSKQTLEQILQNERIVT